MNIIKYFFVLLCCISGLQLNAQKTITILDSGTQTALRGLSVVNDNVVWTSGSNGTIARSTDGGKTFNWLTVAGYEKRDFRDIEAFDANTAIIMAVAEPAIMLKTKDGGKSWYKVFEDTTKGMFLDALDFAGDTRGVVVGDPINGKVFLAYTFDQGENWKIIDRSPQLYSGEALFAASGSYIRAYKLRSFLFYAYVTGGIKSRFFYINKTDSLPVVSGKETTGANSIASWKEKRYAIVGGDFNNDKSDSGNCAISFDGSKTWNVPSTAPHGYRSCVEYITKDKLIACGTTGVDISNDGGNNWQLISGQSFHVCKKAKKGSKIFSCGANGKIATLQK